MRAHVKHALLPRILVAAVCCLVALESCPFPRGAPCLAAGQPDALQTMGEINVRSQVVVDDKRLKLLDFCDPNTIPEAWKTLLAGVDLGPAPEAGKEVSFSSQQLTHHLQRLIAAQGMDPKQTKIQVPERVAVVRQQIPMSREQIEEIFKEFVLKNASWKTEDLAIQQVRFSSIPALPSGDLSYQVMASPHENFIGDVSVTIHFYVNNKEVRNMRVSGKVEVFQDVVHSVRPMKRNEVIAEADIQFLRINIAARPDHYLMQRDQVVGKRLLCSIGPNQPISPRDLDQPALVKRGDQVTITFEQEGIRLSTRGEAKENGRQGDRIRILNVDTKKNVLCQVIDSQTVEVLP
jgi:flagellar basal body P-ring formation protein FlgA